MCSPQHQWSYVDAHRMDENGDHLMIDGGMAIYNDNSVDKTADTAVEELEPTIQNLELEQKFNDAESYLIESGEINGDGTGMIRDVVGQRDAIRSWDDSDFCRLR